VKLKKDRRIYEVATSILIPCTSQIQDPFLDPGRINPLVSNLRHDSASSRVISKRMSGTQLITFIASTYPLYRLKMVWLKLPPLFPCPTEAT